MIQLLKQIRALFGMALAAPFIVVAQLLRWLYVGCNAIVGLCINTIGKVRLQVGGIDMQDGKFEDDPAVVAAKRSAKRARRGGRN